MTRALSVLFLGAVCAVLWPAAQAGYEPEGPRHPCPRPARYHPCTCASGEDGLQIKCKNANLAMLSTAFLYLSSTRHPIDVLELEDCHFERLYGPLLQPLLLRELRVRNTPLRRVEGGVFAGTVGASLQQLHLHGTRLADFPGAALQDIKNLTHLFVEGHQITTLTRDAFSGGAAGGQLVKFSLSQGPLSAIAPAALAPLRRVKRLDLSYNNITALQTAQFKGLRDCEILDLSHNGLTKIQAANFGDLTRLAFLNISHNHLTSIPRSTFARNSVLLVLNMSNNEIRSIDATTFRGMRSVRRLYMANNKINDISRGAFDSLTRVGTIDLSGNQLKVVGFQMFQNLRFIEHINLSRNNISAVEAGAFKELYLAAIDLSNNMVKTVASGAFVQCTNLTILDFSHNLLTGLNKNSLDELSYSGILDLSYNNITDFSKVPLANMTGLQTLNLSHNQVGSIPRNAFPKLYELHTVDLSYNNISDLWPGAFQPLFSLRSLDLAHNALRELRGGALGALHTLLHLDLGYNKLKDVAVGALARLTSLRAVSLRHNEISKPFSPAPTLSHIDLSNNRFTALPERAVWPVMNALLSLDFSHNAIADEGLPRGCLANLLALQRLELRNNSLARAPREALAELSSLQYLGLRGNRLQRLERGAFGGRGRLPVVFTLDLSQNAISNVSQGAFDGFLQLQTLNLSSNNISRIPNGAFQGLVSMRTLDISNNSLDRLDNGTNSLLEDCLSLEHLNISYNHIFVLTKRSLPSSPWVPYKLKNLDLSHNRLSVLNSDFLAGGRRLEQLNIAHNFLSVIRLGVLGNLTSLRRLDLSDNLLKDVPGAAFGPPPALEEVRMAGNALAQLPQKELASLRWALRRLDASGNRISETPLQLLPQLLNGTEMNFSGNPLQCDCRIRPILRWFSEVGTVPGEWANVRCSKPDHLAELALAEVPEPQLVCDQPLSALQPVFAGEENGVEYDVAPDVRFRKVERFPNGSVSATWFIWTRSDVADFLLLARPVPAGGTSPPSAPLAEVDLPYVQRTAVLPLPADIEETLQLCVATRDSLGELRPLRPRSQCQILNVSSGSGLLQPKFIVLVTILYITVYT